MKKLNKLFAILVAMAMVLSLSVIAAFADTQTTALDSSKITKKWAIPEGVADPSLTTSFTFTANRAKSAGVTEDETLPSVATVDAAYNNAQDATHDVLTAGKTVSQDYAIPAPTGVTHAGVYAFDVVETQPVIVAPNIENDSVKKDNTQYRVRYYYENQKVKTSEEGVTPETFENRVVLTGITVAIVNGEMVAHSSSITSMKSPMVKNSLRKAPLTSTRLHLKLPKLLTEKTLLMMPHSPSP